MYIQKITGSEQIRCYFCTRQAVNDLEGKVAMCDECTKAYIHGFEDGRVYQSKLRRIDPQRAKIKGGFREVK